MYKFNQIILIIAFCNVFMRALAKSGKIEVSQKIESWRSRDKKRTARRIRIFLIWPNFDLSRKRFTILSFSTRGTLFCTKNGYPSYPLLSWCPLSWKPRVLGAYKSLEIENLRDFLFIRPWKRLTKITEIFNLNLAVYLKSSEILRSVWRIFWTLFFRKIDKAKVN